MMPSGAIGSKIVSIFSLLVLVRGRHAASGVVTAYKGIQMLYSD